MARVVCQVVHRADRVTFLWSADGASFEPYHLAGADRERLGDIARQARELLARAVASSDGAAAGELAQLGHQLYRAAFRLDADDPAAREVHDWLAGLRDQNQIESLQFLGDAPGRIPWNLLCESVPSGDSLKALWGSRYSLGVGRRVNGLGAAFTLVQPTTLLLVSPEVRDTIASAQLLGMEDAETAAVSALDLANRLRKSVPDVLVLAAPVENGALLFGEQRVTLEDLESWMADAEEGSTDPVIFFAGVGGPEQAAAWPCWLSALAGVNGLVANEVPLTPAQAGQAALAFLDRFPKGDNRLGTALLAVRETLGIAGLAVSGFCPPDVRVVDNPEAATGAEEFLQSLPDYPYRPFAAYTEEDRPLFIGRETDTLRLARLLDDAGTGGVLLQGAAAVGKTSLIQAGLLPALRDDHAGYRALSDRTPDAESANDDDYPPLIVRASTDLTGQFAEALLAYCSQPYTYTTPAGKTVTVDLPALLDTQLGAIRPPSTAIKDAASPAGESTTGIAEPGHAPAAPDTMDEPEALEGRELWLYLKESPDRLGKLLDEITRRLPFELVIAIDQGEELVTLVKTPAEQARRRQALEMLVALAESPARCKLLMAIRNDCAGQLVGLLPEGAGRNRWKSFFLDELSREAALDAVQLPTSQEPAPHSDEVPFQKYGFAFEPGAAQRIVDDAIAEARTQQQAVLPLVQAVCALLYDRRVLERKQAAIRVADLKDIGGVRGALGRCLEARIKALPLPTGAQQSVRALITNLYTPRTDGTLTRVWVDATELRTLWAGSTPVDQAVNTAADHAGLFTIDPLLVGGKEGTYASLPQDSLAQVGKQWDEERRRGAYGKTRVIDTLWIMIPLALLAAAAAFAGTRYYYQAVAIPEAEKALAKKAEQIIGDLQDRNIASRLPYYRGQLAQASQALVSGNMLAARQTLLSEPGLSVTSKDSDLRGFDWDYLWAQANPGRHVLESHRMAVTAVATSADGKRAATASLDGSVKLWDVERGQILATLTAGKRTPLHAVALTADGKTVAAAGADRTVRLWDVGALGNDYAEIDKATTTLQAHTGAVHGLAFAKDGLTLASAGADKLVILWNLKEGKERATLKDHADKVQAVAFSADGKTLASGAYDGTIILWDADAGKKNKDIKTSQEVAALAFAPDGKTFASGGTERVAGTDVGSVRFWQTDNGTAAEAPNPIHQGTAVLAVAYRPDGKALAAAGKDNTVRLWDAASGRALARWAGHLGWVRGLAFASDNTLVSGSHDNTARVWDSARSGGPEVLRGHGDWVQCLALGDRDKLLASGSKDGTVQLWDAQTGAAAGSLTGHNGPITGVAFVARGKAAKDKKDDKDKTDGPLLAVASWGGAKEDGEIKLWRLSKAEKGTGWQGKEVNTLKGHKGGITCLIAHPSEPEVASGGADTKVMLWNTDTGKPRLTLAGGDLDVRCLAYLGESLLISGNADGVVRYWDAKDGKPAGPPFKAHPGPVVGLHFDVTATDTGLFPTLISTGRDGLLRLWVLDQKGFVLTGELRVPGQTIAASTRNQLALVTAGFDDTIRLYQVGFLPRQREDQVELLPELQERFTLTGHTAPVRAVVMNADRTLLASAGQDGTVRLWRAPTTKLARPKQ